MSIPIIQIGKFNHLEVLKETDFGIYIGDEIEEILMPLKWVPEGTKVGDFIEAFIFTDSEDRMIATTIVPKIQLHEFGCLDVKATTSFGAFLDWGLDKDLLAPFKEQAIRMKEGEKHVVYLYLDEVTDRLVATSHINRYLEFEEIELEAGQTVDLLICQESELGYYAIIDGKYKGLLYKSEVFQKIEIGDRLSGFVKALREDKKIDLTLHAQVGHLNIEPNAEKVLEILKRSENGILLLHDKSEPDEIYDQLKMSKKNFKKAIGALYKKKLIRIGDKGVELVK